MWFFFFFEYIELGDFNNVDRFSISLKSFRDKLVFKGSTHFKCKIIALYVEMLSNGSLANRNNILIFPLMGNNPFKRT